MCLPSPSGNPDSPPRRPIGPPVHPAKRRGVGVGAKDGRRHCRSSRPSSPVLPPKIVGWETHPRSGAEKVAYVVRIFVVVVVVVCALRPVCVCLGTQFVRLGTVHHKRESPATEKPESTATAKHSRAENSRDGKPSPDPQPGRSKQKRSNDLPLGSDRLHSPSSALLFSASHPSSTILQKSRSSRVLSVFLFCFVFFRLISQALNRTGRSYIN